MCQELLWCYIDLKSRKEILAPGCHVHISCRPSPHTPSCPTFHPIMPHPVMPHLSPHHTPTLIVIPHLSPHHAATLSSPTSHPIMSLSCHLPPLTPSYPQPVMSHLPPHQVATLSSPTSHHIKPPPCHHPPPTPSCRHSPTLSSFTPHPIILHPHPAVSSLTLLSVHSPGYYPPLSMTL